MTVKDAKKFLAGSRSRPKHQQVDEPDSNLDDEAAGTDSESQEQDSQQEVMEEEQGEGEQGSNHDSQETVEYEDSDTEVRNRFDDRKCFHKTGIELDI